MVTGPTASGKSTLVRRLLRNEAPEVARRLAVGDGDGWAALEANRLHEPGEEELPRVLFHYDFLRPYLRSAGVHARDEALALLDGAREVAFATIFAPPEVLRRRLAGTSLPGRLGFPLKRRHRRILADYGDPSAVRAHYQRWFDHARTRGGDHVVVLEDGARTLPLDDFERSAAWRALGASPARGRS